MRVIMCVREPGEQWWGIIIIIERLYPKGDQKLKTKTRNKMNVVLRRKEKKTT